MKKTIYILTVVFLIAAAAIYLLLKNNSNFSGSLSMENKKVSVVMSAFGGKDDNGNWGGEIAPFMDELKNPVDVTKNVGMCDMVFEGQLSGSEVIVVVSGMGKVRASTCTESLLNYYKGRVKEVIFSGIAGISPSTSGPTGDLLNASDQAMLGDVCINSTAFDFDLQHYSSDQSNSNVANPNFWENDNSFSSKSVNFDPALAQELVTVGNQINWAYPPQDVVTENLQYHQRNRQPKVWGTKNCIEATGDLYWSDTSLDQKAREEGVTYLNKANNSALGANNIVVVTSMEASSVGSAISWWNLEHKTEISYAYVRGASNFDRPYWNSEGVPAISGNDVVSISSKNDYATYAINNASLIVLKMFEARGVKKVN